MDDRRKKQRFRLEESCILNYASFVGTIVDICMGGLSCTCLESHDCHKDSPERSIDIICKGGDLFTQDLPVKVLGSTVVPGEFANGLKVRKCRAQFEQLEYDQKAQLEEIILSYGIH